MNSKNSSAYRPPEGASAPAAPAGPVDNTARCPVCRTCLVTEEVSLRVGNGPSIGIAQVVRCVQSGCTRTPKKVILSAEGRRQGVTEDQIFHLAKQQGGSLSFTKEEFVSGRMAGYHPLPPEPKDNPDRNIEPAQQGTFL